MKRLLALSLLLTSCSFGQKDKAKLTDVEIERGKRIDAELRLLQAQAQPIQKEQQDLILAACKRAGIAIPSCSVNIATGEITETKQDPKK